MNLNEFKAQHYQSFYADVAPIRCSPTLDNGDAYYGYITSPQIDFHAIFANIPLPQNPKVVDLGAGFCENLLRLGHAVQSTDLHAVEMNATYAAQTQPLIALHNLPITYHVSDYAQHDISGYDLIYSFCIAKRQPEYRAFNEYVLNNMKVGAVWIEALARESKPENPSNVDSVYRAIELSDKSFEILFDDFARSVVRRIA